MNDLSFRYAICSDLPGRTERAASLGAKFIDTLDALSRIDPSIFTSWQVMDLSARASVPLVTARSRIGAIIEGNVTRDDFGEPEPYYGFGAIAFTGDVTKSRHISLQIKAGGSSKGDTRLETGYWKVPADPAIVTYPLFKAAMLAINTIWPPFWSCANAFRMDYDKVPLFLGAPLFPYSPFHIPWLAYLSTPLAAGLMLPVPEIAAEHMPGDGLLMTVTRERLDPTNPEYLRRARVLAETMIACTGYQPGGPVRE